MLRDSLSYFIATCRNGSIRAASAELGIAQSAVSRQLQALEYELGAHLFQRHVNGIVLTPAGESLYRYARASKSKADQFLSKLAELKGEEGGTVQISAIESVVSSILPTAISAASLRLPGLRYSIRIARSDDVLQDVIDGHADFGICLDAPRSHDLTHHKRHIEPLMVVTSSRHPIASLQSVTIEQLSQWPLAISSRTIGAGRMFELACRRAHTIMRICLETNSIELLRSFMDFGGGAAIMTYQSCVSWMSDRDLCVREIDDAWLKQISTDVIVASRRSLTTGATLLLDEICKQLDLIAGRTPISPT